MEASDEEAESRVGFGTSDQLVWRSSIYTVA